MSDVDRPQRLFDVHTHAWPAGLYQAITGWFDEHAWSIAEPLDGDAAAEHLGAQGVSRWVAMAYAHRPGMAHELNQWLGAYARRHSEAVVLATVHPHDDDPRGLLAEAFDEHGLQGVKLHCHVMGIAPDDAALDPILEMLMERDLPLVIHAGREPALPAYRAECHAVSGAGRVRTMLERHPELRCVVPHLGYDEFDDFEALLGDYPRLMTDCAMAMSGFFPHTQPVGFLERWPDRVMYGTDFPILPYPYDREWRALRSFELDPELERKLFWDNAERFFGTG